MQHIHCSRHPITGEEFNNSVHIRRFPSIHKSCSALLALVEDANLMWAQILVYI